MLLGEPAALNWTSSLNRLKFLHINIGVERQTIWEKTTRRSHQRRHCTTRERSGKSIVVRCECVVGIPRWRAIRPNASVFGRRGAREKESERVSARYARGLREIANSHIVPLPTVRQCIYTLMWATSVRIVYISPMQRERASCCSFLLLEVEETSILGHTIHADGVCVCVLARGAR